MKRLFVTLLFAGIFSFIPSSLHHLFSSPLSAQIPSDGLVAWYPFNGNANDESGNGNHGVVNGATLTTDRFGNPNSAYHFDGVDDFIDLLLPENSVGVPNSFTISFWFKISQLPLEEFTSNPIFVVRSFYTNQAYSEHDDIGIWVTNQGIVHTGLRSNDGLNFISFNQYLERTIPCSSHLCFEIGNENNQNDWHHIVLGFNNFQDYYTAGLDLTFDGQHAIDNMLAPISNQSPALSQLRFGMEYLFGTAHFFSGEIDDVVLYSATLSDSLREELYLDNLQNNLLLEGLNDTLVSCGGRAKITCRITPKWIHHGVQGLYDDGALVASRPLITLQDSTVQAGVLIGATSELTESSAFENFQIQYTSTNPLSFEFSGLATDSLYYFRFYIQTEDTIFFDEVDFFRTKRYIAGNGVTDIDGNYYNTVIIGNQEWMASDLKTTRFANGDTLLTIQGSYTNQQDYYYNTSLLTPQELLTVPIIYKRSCDSELGNHYNYAVVQESREICPTGWRVSNERDWVILEQYVNQSALEQAYYGGFKSYPDLFESCTNGTGLSLGGKFWSEINVNEPCTLVDMDVTYGSFSCSKCWWLDYDYQVFTNNDRAPTRETDFTCGLNGVYSCYDADEGKSIRCIKEN
jgi:uncharacterized protein (TIGR02145 family)